MIRFRKVPFLICCICIAALAVAILGGWLTGSRVSMALAQALGLLSGESIESYMQAFTAMGNAILAAEHFLLGIFVCWLVAMLRKDALEVFLVSGSCCLTFACVCETLHMVLPGSSGSLSHVLWGALGTAIGVGILVLCFRFCLKANRRPVHTPKHAEKKTNSKHREMPKFKDMD